MAISQSTKPEVTLVGVPHKSCRVCGMTPLTTTPALARHYMWLCPTCHRSIAAANWRRDVYKSRGKSRENNLKRAVSRDYAKESRQRRARLDEGERVRNRARNKLYKAVMAGRVVRQPCERCGNHESHAHHSDYTKPLSVIWLCRRCHANEHHPLDATAAELSGLLMYSLARVSERPRRSDGLKGRRPRVEYERRRRQQRYDAGICRRCPSQRLQARKLCAGCTEKVRSYYRRRKLDVVMEIGG